MPLGCHRSEVLRSILDPLFLLTKTISPLEYHHANVINPVTKSMVILPANCVAVGSSVSVAPGDKIPCDGVVTEGKSAIDESSLTGESRPIQACSGTLQMCMKRNNVPPNRLYLIEIGLRFL